MKYCRNCLIPDTRPNGGFTAAGLCIPCEYSLKKGEMTYERRFRDLKSVINKIKAKGRRSRWDCIVGVSGGKDSTRQALWVRDKLEMEPLLVSVVYPPGHISEIGADNLDNLINLGFDTYVVGPAPMLSRELLREAFFRFCNWAKATEMALFASVPRVAIEKKVSLILWGENPAVQIGDQGAAGVDIWDGNNLINTNTISGGNLDWFEEVAGGPDRLGMYRFPNRQYFLDGSVRTIFLGPAWPDWTSEYNSRVSLAHGIRYRDKSPDLTGDLLGTRMIDEDWFIVNMLLKYYKLGFSRGTEQANFAIREGLITREEGVAIAERYDDACGEEYIRDFCRYISITEKEFWQNVRKFANKDLFDTSGTRPRKKFKVGVGLEE